MNIKQSVVNTFNRVGIDYEPLLKQDQEVEVNNRFGGGSCKTSPLMAHLIAWVYQISNNYEIGDFRVKTADFDRIRYFIAEKDSNAYSVCID